MKHNCYTCKHREESYGSCHSSCNAIGDNKIIAAMWVIQNNGQFQNLQLNPHGMKNGWANWPLDFDPVWVDRCDFYQGK